MQSRNYGRSPGPRNYTVPDLWKPWAQKLQPKCHLYGNWSHGDQSSSKIWYRRPKPINSNLMRFSYCEPQYNPQQPRQRLMLKNCSSAKIENLHPARSKKSIPNHALMKNLLSGLSIFEGDEGNSESTAMNIYRRKSTGTLNRISHNRFDGRPTVKSSIDFGQSSQSNKNNFNDDDFREYCRNYAKQSIATLHRDEILYARKRCPLENYFAPRTCTDNMCSCNLRLGTPENDSFFPRYPKQVTGRQEEPAHLLYVKKRNIVQERKQFFEKKEKDMQEECRMKTRFKPQIVETASPCLDSESITELFRNAKPINSATTISRSKHSRLRINQPKHVHLFNAEYSFDANSSGSDMRQSIIDSIRTKIFQTPSSYADEDDDFDSGKFPKFPRETRKAVSIIMNQKKVCKCRNRQLLSVETQTSPFSSKHSFWNSEELPCTKNLLCGRGYHTGNCEEEVSRKLESICREDCCCRKENYSSEELRSTFWSMKPKRDVPLQNDVTVVEDSYENQTDFNQLSCTECYSINNNNESNYKLYDDDLKLSLLNSFDEVILSPRETCEKIRERASYVSSPILSPTMNGMNGHSNGDLNGCGDIITQNQQRGCWTIGLINAKYRYLTAETFGFKINANGTSLKKKQIWTLEPDSASGGETCVYLRSHLDKYLAVDSFGNVTCESEEKEPGSRFQVSVSEDGKGRWAFRNVVRGYFLGSSSDKLTCTAKVPTDAEFWHIHLAARPQVNLRSVGRKRFAHLSENLDEIHVDANIPWGEDTLFTLEFHADEDGKYALHTCNNKYLSNGGKLVDKCTEDCLFSAEYHSGQLALRDRNGAYLSPIGSKAVLKTRSNTVTKDELFSLEDSLPQASFVAALNARYVSVKQGVDVTANQDEISDHETFQLEFDWSTKRWYIRTMQDKYWTLETGGGIQASGDKRSSNALFDLVWQNDGSLAFRANNGRYVITKRSGHLYATSDAIDDTCKYYFYLINRPILVLKCEQGFVGYKAAGNPKLECNKATYECIQVERAEKGVIHFKGQNGKYWHVDSESVTADSDAPESFYLELREPTRLCIKNANGNYLTASKNGVFRLGDTSIENATQWEY